MTDEEKTSEAKHSTKHDRRKGKSRAHGTGSVFQRKDRKGKQWVAQIFLENGKTRQRYFSTEKEAAEALHTMLYEQRQGTLITEHDQDRHAALRTLVSSSQDNNPAQHLSHVSQRP